MSCGKIREKDLCSVIDQERTNCELWKDLGERFMVGNGPRKNELKAALANCRQGGDTVNKYYSRMKNYGMN